MPTISNKQKTLGGKRERENAVTRLLTVVCALASKKGGLTYAEIQDYLARANHKVSRRTIERDIDTLMRFWEIERVRKGTTVRWKLLGPIESELPFPLETLELFALTIAYQALAVSDLRWLAPYLKNLVARLRPEFSRSYQKFFDFLENKFTNATIATPNPPGCCGRYDSLMEAIIQRRRVIISYRDSKDQLTKNREIAPLLIVHERGGTYLAAHCFRRNGHRLFRLSRIQNLEVTDKTFDDGLLEGLKEKLGTSLGAFHAEPEKVVVEVDKLLARYLEENPIHRSQTLKKEKGRYYVHLFVGLNETLFHQLMGFGPHARVIEPQKLASLLLERHREALEYQTGVITENRIQPDLPLSYKD
ncbi:MAG: WYL domain-containing protein [Candidatus Sumerlaeaceae bacterium]|nr:WYL domain-containing protein [Candidatus Sumerlaeaceae bacterium]